MSWPVLVHRRKNSPQHTASGFVIDAGRYRHRLHCDEVCAGNISSPVGGHVAVGGNSYHVLCRGQASVRIAGRIRCRAAGNALRMDAAIRSSRIGCRTGDERERRQRGRRADWLAFAAICGG